MKEEYQIKCFKVKIRNKEKKRKKCNINYHILQRNDFDVNWFNENKKISHKLWNTSRRKPFLYTL